MHPYTSRRQPDDSLLRPDILLVIAAAACIVALGMGMRQAFGLFMPSVTGELGGGREMFGLAIALQNLLWGLSQPGVGMLADRYGSRLVAACGGLDASVGAAALALVGLFNMIGSLTFGGLGDRLPKPKLLSALYAGRVVVIIAFLLTPLTTASTLIFSAAIGFLWLGTVPLTSGLVAQIFGPRYLSSLFGIVFLSHQLGSFSGAWLGGWIFEIAGSYDMVWILAVVLGVLATALHLPISDKALPKPATA
ncbi:MFS family permease [Natronocella acetinitrilica]|uniref:MFS family permease n=1 Tax=Natronocella acetinitrilica TaxID=414046 RepID=A0AAE3G4B1_9GAMM|nr:MFS transporter [Natronocella acetinitrilica]MCP1673647.1 MFS family permease [Natronocella acetinitrilica]